MSPSDLEPFAHGSTDPGEDARVGLTVVEPGELGGDVEGVVFVAEVDLSEGGTADDGCAQSARNSDEAKLTRTYRKRSPKSLNFCKTRLDVSGSGGPLLKRKKGRI
jgi:hypothetical protein